MPTSYNPQTKRSLSPIPTTPSKGSCRDCEMCFQLPVWRLQNKGGGKPCLIYLVLSSSSSHHLSSLGTSRKHFISPLRQEWSEVWTLIQLTSCGPGPSLEAWLILINSKGSREPLTDRSDRNGRCQVHKLPARKETGDSGHDWAAACVWKPISPASLCGIELLWNANHRKNIT